LAVISKVSLQRGKLIESELAENVMATVHPSSILRTPDADSRLDELKRFVGDLKRWPKSCKLFESVKVIRVLQGRNPLSRLFFSSMFFVSGPCLIAIRGLPSRVSTNSISQKSDGLRAALNINDGASRGCIIDEFVAFDAITVAGRVRFLLRSEE